MRSQRHMSEEITNLSAIIQLS